MISPVLARPLLLVAPLAFAVLTAACGSSSGGGTAPALTGGKPPVASVTILAGNGQTGAVSTTLGTTVQVKALDAAGAPLAGDTILFIAGTGGAQLTGTTAVTNAAGIATLGGFTLGRCAGPNVVYAKSKRTANVSAVISATGTGGAAGYCIEMLFTSEPDPVLRAAAEAAAVKWGAILNATSFAPETLNLDPATLPANEQKCANISVPLVPTRIVKGLLILVELVAIPNPSPGLVTLGQAGPCYIRIPGNLTVMGGLRLNADYLINNLNATQRQDVVTHEMGHVLGYGTLWDAPLNLITNPINTSGPTAQPLPGFVGSNARARWTLMGGPASPASVPVEGCGGGGTVNGHWRESSFGDEMMTGYISAPGGGRNPLSALTIASMADMGYSVDMAQAEAFTINTRTCPATGSGTFNVGSLVIADASGHETQVVEILQKPTHVASHGQLIPIRR